MGLEEENQREGGHVTDRDALRGHGERGGCPRPQALEAQGRILFFLECVVHYFLRRGRQWNQAKTESWLLFPDA